MDHALKLFRVETAQSAAELAAIVGTSRQTIYRIERRMQHPSLGLVARLITASGGRLSADDFLPGPASPTVPDPVAGSPVRGDGPAASLPGATP